MQTVEREAAKHVQRGIALAGREALFSARSELIQGLRVLTLALDSVTQTTEHTEALAAALRALNESDDFMPPGTQLEADMKLPLIVAAHRTPLFAENVPANLSPLVARQRYYSFAQEQFARAAAHSRTGSMALYAMARIEAQLGANNPAKYPAARSKAMALHQAALMVDDTNYMAANELGVLLAEFGQYEVAQKVLLHSVRTVPGAAAWHNLAVIYRHLGKHRQEQQAREQAQRLAAVENAPQAALAGNNIVRWTSPEAFRRMNISTQQRSARASSAGGTVDNPHR